MASGWRSASALVSGLASGMESASASVSRPASRSASASATGISTSDDTSRSSRRSCLESRGLRRVRPRGGSRGIASWRSPFGTLPAPARTAEADASLSALGVAAALHGVANHFVVVGVRRGRSSGGPRVASAPCALAHLTESNPPGSRVLETRGRARWLGMAKRGSACDKLDGMSCRSRSPEDHASSLPVLPNEGSFWE